MSEQHDSFYFDPIQIERDARALRSQVIRAFFADLAQRWRRAAATPSARTA